MENIVILSGNSNKSLAYSIAKYLKLNLCPLILDKFNNGEIRCQIQKNIRNNIFHYLNLRVARPIIANIIEIIQNRITTVDSGHPFFSK